MMLAPFFVPSSVAVQAAVKHSLLDGFIHPMCVWQKYDQTGAAVFHA